MSPIKNIEKVAAQSVNIRNLIGEQILQTPCLATRESFPNETRVYLKTENFQHTGSFKIRGAISKLKHICKDSALITASSGNHGIACSHAAMVTGHNLTVVLPENVAKSKLAKINSYGVSTILRPGDSGLAEQHARSLAENGDFEYISPYNDNFVIAGQGTIGLELLEQLPRIDNVFISMGGGGLISGIGSVLKSFSPSTKIFGASAKNSGALAASMLAGQIVETEHLDTLADGCAGGVDEGSVTLPIASEVIDRVIECSEDQIIDAIRKLAWTENIIVEGAAALAFAAFLAEKSSFEGKTNVVLLCGGNFDKNVFLPIVSR